MASRIRNNQTHTFHFTILLLLFLVGFIAFARINGNPREQILITILMGITYVVWGLFHHYFEHNLNWKVVIEYISIACIGVLTLWLLLSLNL